MAAGLIGNNAGALATATSIDKRITQSAQLAAARKRLVTALSGGGAKARE